MSFIYSCRAPTRSFYLILSGVGMRHVLNRDPYNSPPVNSPTGIQSHMTKKTQTYTYKLPAEWICVYYTAPLLTLGFVYACFSALYTVCMTVTLQSCGRKVSRAKNITPLKHGTAGLCWNLSLARSLDVFTAAEQWQQNAMLTSHSGMDRVNCDRLRSCLDCSIESGKKKTLWMEQFLCESSPVHMV